jgi:hypothetical protein
MVEEYSFHNEGYGEFQGGNGQYLTFVLSDEAFLTGAF